MKSYRFQPIRELLQLLFPTPCCGCGEPLVGSEHHLCSNCLLHLPETNYSEIVGNVTELRLQGRIPFQAATSLLYFSKGNITQHIVHSIKYYDNIDLGHLVGRRLGAAIADSHRFDDVDLLVPVPLHRFRKWKRGYNQSEILCEGIAQKFPRPINTKHLVRTTYTHSQTHKNHDARRENILQAFSVRAPKVFQGKHILLVDDVITTGATTGACWDTLAEIEGIRISVASLAVAMLS